ncbi:HK97-gp10 family putative phage morphogenesis protein [Accumulibacter sp.]|jgi:phage protein, HK97 gp10 family|uniref:HK97-gp10 family putative phage morphogenesis protein n=1 Tax=Accumulibacter sp. TaxID=2053492 RepID=UPI001ACA32BD|nr:HK97-gp10 family putative phage morphogenesis protein [Accumulibacter sp.]MBN8515281.1 HK97 gp10 family phage protein [Accumulibacter sp.]MBO3701576.1 HK97 gp10 family phage protein [Accumulibacter sp.]
MLTVDKAGLEALNQRLQGLSTKAGKAAVRQAARKAMAPVRAEVQANAPEDLTEPDAVRIKASTALFTNWKSNTLYARVGIKGGAKKNPSTPFYFRMHEFGTKSLPARPFMAPALEGNAQDVLDTVADEMAKRIFG